MTEAYRRWNEYRDYYGAHRAISWYDWKEGWKLGLFR